MDEETTPTPPVADEDFPGNEPEEVEDEMAKEDEGPEETGE